MPRTLTPQSSLENFKREAKQWLKAIRAGDASAHARLGRAIDHPPAEPTLRDVQLALAREHGLAGWAELTKALQSAASPTVVALDSPDDVERLVRDDPYALRPGGRWDKLIIRAAERSPATVIESLVRHGASVHARDDHRTAAEGAHGYSALHAAAYNGNLDAVRALLAHGANPADRDDTFWRTPAAWASHAGHVEVRDRILQDAIDIFEAIQAGRVDRVQRILIDDPQAFERPFNQYVTSGRGARFGIDPAWTPLEYARAIGNTEATRVLEAAMARSAGDRTTFDDDVATFLHAACLDWRIGGSGRAYRTEDAGRLLARKPAIARANIFTAVVSGERDEVERRLSRDSRLAATAGGPRAWTPLLYLCSARLPGTAWSVNAVDVARLLLDHGADANTFYFGGNADIHYTALTCVLGRGEEMGAMHPEARALTSLLLDRGADPHDGQVLYNVFADNTSRHLLDDDIVWLLDLMYEHSVRRGHKEQWETPTWPMFDMRGAPSLGDDDRVHHGARFMLDAAVDRNLVRMAEWLLAHGADPNTPPGNLWKGPRTTLYQKALERGNAGMLALLRRYGTDQTPRPLDDREAFVDACLRLDRDAVRAAIKRHPEYLTEHHALFAAANQDRDDVIQMLIDLGIPATVKNPQSGITALHATAHGAPRAAELLLAHGADVDARDYNYHSPPLGWATYFLAAEMIELFGSRSRDVWFLVRAGCVHRLREVLSENPTLARVSNDGGETPLMWLPSDSSAALEAASLLLEHGANPTDRDTNGRTAAAIARQRGLDAVAELLDRAASA